MDYLKLPKVELHLHLDGSLNIDLVSKITKKKKEEITNILVAPDKCIDLNDYLKRFTFPVSMMQTKDDLELFSYELSKDLEKDNVIYAEVRFAPNKHIMKLTLSEVVESIINGFKKGNVEINLILCMMRGDFFEDNLNVILLAEKYLNKGVCAIDLAGAEALYKTKDYEELFKIASRKNIPFTIHAGEADSAKSIADAISFGAKRIGHGIRITEDDDLMKLVKDKNILLEICPTSNVQTNVINNIKEHNIKTLYEYGLKISINTDNRTVSNTTLTKEYELLENNFQFTKEDFIEMNLNAIDAAFLSNEEKQELKEKYLKLIEVSYEK